METPETDKIMGVAADSAVGDMPFNEAIELCKKLEEQLEMANCRNSLMKLALKKVLDYCPPRKKDLGFASRILDDINKEDDSQSTSEPIKH